MQPALLDAVISHRRQRLLHFALQALLQRRQVTPLLQLAVFVIHYAEADLQMVRHLLPLPRVAIDGNAGHTAQLALQGIQQRQLKRRDAAQKRLGIVRRGYKVTSDRFRQRLDQGDNQLPAQTGDLPLETALLHLVKQRQRNVHRHAVGVRARLKLVAQTQLQVALMPKVGVVQLADLLRALLNQHALFKVEQIRRFAAGLFPPAVKVAGRNGVDANALVVKLKQRVVIHQNVSAARLMLQLFDLGAQLQVLAEEGVPGLPVALH